MSAVLRNGRAPSGRPSAPSASSSKQCRNCHRRLPPSARFGTSRANSPIPLRNYQRLQRLNRQFRCLLPRLLPWAEGLATVLFILAVALIIGGIGAAISEAITGPPAGTERVGATGWIVAIICLSVVAIGLGWLALRLSRDPKVRKKVQKVDDGTV